MDFQIVFESILVNWSLLLLFFTAAILYSSVGFGGGSSYLAILAFAGIAFTQVRIIGFLSGMVGIGGGIFLAPLLHLTNWDTPRKIAATASFFILVNSIAGVFGQYNNPDFHIDWTLTSILLVTVFIGGQIGSRVSNTLLTPILLKKTTGILIGFVSIRIIYKHLSPLLF